MNAAVTGAAIAAMLTSLANGQVLYTITTSGQYGRVNPAGERIEPLPAAPSGFGTFAGFEFTADGTLWLIEWSMQLFRWDREANRWINRGNVRTLNPSAMVSGFIKDLAWDPVGNRMLALHTGQYRVGNRPVDAVWIHELNLETGVLTPIGQVPALTPYSRDYPMAMAVDSAGAAWVGTLSDRELYRISLTDMSAELVATFPNGYRCDGLAIDWRRDDQMYLARKSACTASPRRSGSGNMNAADIAISPCLADIHTDGFLDFFDYTEFVDAFEQGRPRADLNGDGHLDFFDYERMVTAFESGC